MSETYRVSLIGCGRMGATIDDEIPHEKYRDIWVPFSHAAAYDACDRTELVSVCDAHADRAETIRERYSAECAYTDYQTMIREVTPDIVSIATKPASHADMTVFAAENGVRGIYCEKSLCCSMEEADRMLHACKANGVVFNYGAQRRYMPVYREMRRLAESGELGELKVTIGCHGGESAALWGQTHTVDVLMFLAGDPDVTTVQGTAIVDPDEFDDDRIDGDPPIPAAAIQFSNGVWGYVVSRPGSDYEVSGTNGTLVTTNEAVCTWLQHDSSTRENLLREKPFPETPAVSGTINAVQEIVEELDGGQRTTGNIDVACRSQEIVFAILESERHRGARVTMPLEHRSLYVARSDF
jgi:scyllo-inositol 2-dehydrogenase (NAD+)